MSLSVFETYGNGTQRQFALPANALLHDVTVAGVRVSFSAPSLGVAVLSVAPAANAQVRMYANTMPSPQPSLYLPLRSSVIPQVGYGAANYVRGTPATVEDHEGVIRTALAGEVRFKGARRVANLVGGSSSDLTAATPAFVSGAVITATTVELTDVGTSFSYVNSSVSQDWVGRTVVASALVSSAVAQTVCFRLAGSADGTGAASINVSLTSTPKRISLTASGFASIAQSMVFGVENRAGVGASNTAAISAITFTELQVEDVTGQSNQAPGEYVSVGAAKLNELIYSNAFTTAPWATYQATVTVNQTTAPDGTLTAAKLVALSAGVGDANTYQLPAVTPGTAYTFSGYFKAAEESVGQIIITDGATNYYVTADLTNGVITTTTVGVTGSIASAGNGWYRLTAARTVTNASIQVSLALATTPYPAISEGIYIWGAQLEQGSSAGDYFPVGNVYPYHGACVDGVKYFETTNGNSVVSNVVTEGDADDAYVALSGAANGYASTPDSAAVSITGDLDLRVRAALDDWTPSSLMVLIARHAGSERSYFIWIDTSGYVALLWNSDGTPGGNTIVGSTVPTGFANGTAHYIRATLDADNGAGGNDIKFYTSEDGVTWTQLGATVTTAGIASIYDGTAPLSVGADGAGAFLSTGKIYYAEVRNGIGGPVVACFDADDGIGQSSFESSQTGETWTLQGDAYTSDRTSSPISPATLLGYRAEGARTNVVVQSQDFATTWAASNTTVTANSTVSPDGTQNADTLNATVSFGSVSQNIAFTGDATKSVSIFLKEGTSTNTVIDLFDVTAATSRLGVIVDWTVSPPSIANFSGSGTIYNLVSYPNGWYRVSFDPAGVVAANTNSLSVYGAGALTGTVLAWGAQAENATFASTYIPTTTASVTRNADVLTYQAAGNAVTTAGSVACSLSTQWTSDVDWGVAVGLSSVHPVAGLVRSGTVLSTAIRLYDGTNSVTDHGVPSMFSAPQKVAASWGSTGMLLGAAGDITSGVFDGSMNIGTNISVGCDPNGDFGWGGSVADLSIHSTKLHELQLKQLTA